MLTPLGLSTSVGFDDRLGLATPGHIAAVRGIPFAPIFSQQSVRENACTGCTPQQVLDDAKRAVERACQTLHVTFGSTLAVFGLEIKTALAKAIELYSDHLRRRFRKHLDLLR